MKYRIIKPTNEELENASKKWKRKPKEPKECKLCHSIFQYGTSSTLCCEACKVMIICEICGKEFEYKFAKSGRAYAIDSKLKENIINGNTEDLKIICPDCQKESNPGFCTKCGKFNKKRDSVNRGQDVGYGDGEWIDEKDNICGCKCSYNFYWTFNTTEEKRESSRKLAQKNFIDPKKAYPFGGRCIKCGKPNKKLDQCGRGTDVVYGDGEWIADRNTINEFSKEIYAFKGEKCGCDCSYKAHLIIGKKSTENHRQPGICSICKRDTRLDNPPTERTSACVCNHCQAKIMNKINDKKREEIELGIRKDWGGCMSEEWWIFNNAIQCNKNCKGLPNCNKNCLKNQWGWCEKILNFGNGNFKYNNYFMEFCQECNMETPHALDENNNLYCQCCAGEKIYYNELDSFITIDSYNKIIKEKKEKEENLLIMNKYNLDSDYYRSIIYIENKDNISFEEACQLKRNKLDINVEKEKNYAILEKYGFYKNHLNNFLDIIKNSNGALTLEDVCIQKRNEINELEKQKEEKLSLLDKYNLKENDYRSICYISTAKSISFEEACKLKRSILDADDLYREEVALISDFGFLPRRLNSLKKRAEEKGMVLNDYMDILVWCDECQQFEDPEYNTIPEHWKNKNRSEFFLCRIWMNDHKEEVEYLEKNIIGFDKLLDGKVHCGVYRWYIDGIPYYFGLSNDILRRAHEHFMNIVDYPDWWLNIYEEMKNGHTLEIKFVEYDLEDLEQMEKYHIFQELPVSQICKGKKPDNIIPLHERLYNMNNLAVHYEERINGLIDEEMYEEYDIDMTL